jgi:diguanylate cyclase (GGDEF)-like protein/PAS domain S-box-containing protein
MTTSKRAPNAIRAVEIKARELALEDSLRGAAQAVASEIEAESGEPERRRPATYPFELALTQQARDADLRFGTLFERAPVGLAVLSISGEILIANLAFAGLFGAEGGAALGLSVSNLLSGAVIERLGADGVTGARDFAAAHPDAELSGTRRDGVSFPCHAMLDLVEIGERTLAVLAVRDISLERTRDRRLTEELGRLRLLLDAVPDAIVAVNQAGRVVELNARAAGLLEVTRAGALGRSASKLMGETVGARFRDALGAADAATAQRETLRIGRAEREEFPIEIRVGAVVDAGTPMAVATLRAASAAAEAPLAATPVPLADATLASLGEALISIDPGGQVRFLNRAAEALTGWTWQEASGQPIEAILHVADVGARGSFTNASPGAAQLHPSLSLMRRNGTQIPIEGSVAPIDTHDGRPAGTVIVFRDATHARAEARQMAHSAQHDALTGLPNRVLLHDRIANAISIAPRHSKRVAVLFLDLDGFKGINDTFGHAAGDKLLKMVAERLAACVRGSDTVSRLGGDEFVVLLSEVERPEDSAITARRMIEAVSEPYVVDRHEVRVTVSIGVSTYPDDGVDADLLIKNADAAMYQAKESGRHGYQFYKPAMNLRAIERQEVEESLRQALDRGEFALHFQPKVNLATGAISGAEALLRWEHPTRGAMPPTLFVPVAEASGLIHAIGQWVMREACRHVQSWHDAGLKLPSVAINISAAEFLAPHFLDRVFAVLNDTGLDPRALQLEINESVLMKHADVASSVLDPLSASGIQMSVDNFGTGYSSLKTLRKFPIQMLKIDQSFVREITLAKGEASLVTAVLNMAQSLNLRVVAEGVETSQELAFLQQHRCDEAQGYYFSRPLPAAEFAGLLKYGLLTTMANRRYGQPFGRLHGHAAI